MDKITVQYMYLYTVNSPFVDKMAVQSMYLYTVNSPFVDKMAVQYMYLYTIRSPFVGMLSCAVFDSSSVVCWLVVHLFVCLLVCAWLVSFTEDSK